MDPAISGLHALFANVYVRAGELDLIEMRTIHEILRRIFKAVEVLSNSAGAFAEAETSAVRRGKI